MSNAGTFTFGPKPSTLAVAIEHVGDDPALLELTLHLPASLQAEGDAFAPAEGSKATGSIVYDRDPGQAALQVLALQRRVDPKKPLFEYTLVAVIDGHEMHDHCVMGDESWIAWRTTLPARATQPAPTGAVTGLALEGGVVADGSVSA